MSTPQSPNPTPTPATSWGGQALKVCVALVALAGAGFYIAQQLKPKPAYEFNANTFAFADHAQSNAPLAGCDVGSLAFVGLDGTPADLKQYLGQKNVVVVVTRGNTSGTGEGARYRNICLYCATQTSRLIANYPAFCDQQAEVVVVFPIRQTDVPKADAAKTDVATADGAKTDDGPLQQFEQALARTGATTEPPFPLVLDVDLRAVGQLGIRADLSKPATYIVDKQGQVRFAYVGATIADRPSVQSLLDQLNAINADAK